MKAFYNMEAALGCARLIKLDVGELSLVICWTATPGRNFVTLTMSSWRSVSIKAANKGNSGYMLCNAWHDLLMSAIGIAWILGDICRE